jgi:MoaA/NifB/PqqE/SkfB family radical SAM enzyme
MITHQEIKEELNSKGCGFCLAKWTQVTIHLQMGQTHSCHHPSTHQIPLSELKRNPSALHNTKFKKEKRKEMLEGKRPDECGYCWNVEDNSDKFSDRVYKSHEPWSQPHMDEIKNLDWRADYNPRYVEVAFSNVCNFKCSYCGPSFSSKWVQESKKFGGYPTSENFNNLEYLNSIGQLPIPHTEFNPYVEAFWKWWPDLYRDLHTFRITGGEPLLTEDTWKILDYIIDEPNPNRTLKLGINSNLGVPDILIDKLIEKIKIIEDNNMVKELVLYTSCDTWGEQAEYIRNGLEFNRFWENVTKILASTNKVVVVFMSTYNALSIFNYDKLIRGVYSLKKQFNSKERYWTPAVFLDSSYLRYPLHQSVQVLPYDFSDKIYDHYLLADSLRDYNDEFPGFVDIEIDKIKRIYDWMIAPQDGIQQSKNRHDFYKFFSEHDRRRNTDFIKTFPELEEFYNFSKTIQI